MDIAGINTNPTEGQKISGNYRKGHARVHGLDITIENPAGSYRSGMGADGKSWRSKLPNHYGYIRGTAGADGDHVDVYLGHHLKSPKVFVVDQHDPDSGEWDEHKCFVGFGSKKQAVDAYAKAFSDGKGHARIGHVETMSIADFKDWLRHSDTKAPIGRAEGGRVQGMIQPGTIDLNNRPVVHNADGTISTVRSIGANVDDKEMLLPTVYGQSILNNDDAVRLYRMSGQHLGQFDTPDNSDAYAQQLHEDQADMYRGRAEGGQVGGPPPFEATSDVPAFDQTEPTTPDAGKLSAAWQGAKQGATFGFGDEMAGVRAAAPDWVPESIGPLPVPGRDIAGAARLGLNAITGMDPNATKQYEEARDAERRALASAKENHPWITAGSEMAGSIPAMAAQPELGAAKFLAPAAGKIARFGAGALDSAFSGGLYGAASGAGEGEGIVDRAVKGATGLVSGILGGGLAHTIGTGIGAAAEKYGAPVVNTVRGWMNPEGEAARRLGSALMDDQKMIQAGTAKGMPVAEWIAAKQAGEPVTLADLGSSRTQALLRSAANTSPEGRAQLEKMIEDRFASQSERVADTLRNVVPGGQANARKSADQLVAEYDQARTPAYKAAYQAGDKPIMSPAMERLMSSDTFVGAMKRAISSGKDRDVAEGLGGFNPMVNVTPDGRIVFNQGAKGVPTYPNLQYWDQVKRELDSVANQAKRSGDTSSVAGQLAKVLRGELDTQVPAYQKARGIAEDYFGESNALDAGRKLAGKKMDPNDIRVIMGKMNPDERALFKEGYASDMAGRVAGGIRDTRDVTKAMFASPNERKMAAAIFGPGGMSMLQARMSLETIMDGARRAMGNSTTARQLIEAGLAGGAVGGLASGWDPMTMGQGFLGGAGARAGASKFLSDEIKVGAKNLIGKVDAKTARHVAELLTSDDPRLLRQGYQMAAKSQSIMQGLRNIANRVALAGQTPARQPVEQGVRALLPYRGPNLGGLQGPVPANADEQQPRP